MPALIQRQPVDYPTEFCSGLHGACAQYELWMNYLPELKDQYRGILALPDIARYNWSNGIEGWVLVPHPLAIAPSTDAAMAKIVGIISTKVRARTPSIKAEYISCDPSPSWRDELYNRHRGGFVPLMVQAGRKYLGLTAEQARAKMGPEELGGTPYEALCMLCLHPERLMGNERLPEPDVRCAGVTTTSCNGGNKTEATPAFRRTEGVLIFEACATNPPERSGPFTIFRYDV